MAVSTVRELVYRAIDAERDRQSEKWGGRHAWGTGDCSSSAVPVTVKACVLNEEVGEVNRAVLEQDRTALRRELEHVAAVAVAWLEAM